MNTHPAADLFPLMTEDELRQLAGDIAANGQREAIVMHEGLILDGRNRWLACEGIGIRPLTREFDPVRDGESLTAYVISANLRRRHLSGSQRAAIAMKALPQAEAEAKHRMSIGGQTAGRGRPLEKGSPKVDHPIRSLHGGRAAAEVAAAAGVSPTLIYEARRLATEAPDLFQQVEAGELSLHKAGNKLERRQSPTAKGGDTTKKPKRAGPRSPKPMSDAEFNTQLAEQETQTRAAFAYDTLEQLGRCRFEPAEVVAAIPANQRHRIDSYLKPALDWLIEFHRIWTADDPA